jgi:ubiquitin thioesterase OTU1
MRIRLRSPDGTHTLSLEDSATVNDLREKIIELTSVVEYDLKIGYPPQTLDLTKYSPSTSLKDLDVKLNGEQIIVVSKDAPKTPPVVSQTSSQPKSSTLSSSQETSSIGSFKPVALTRKTNDVEDNPPEVPLPAHGGRLVLRVMPDDNSCLFRSLGICLLGNGIDAMTELRSIVASAIQADPETYSDVVLQRPRDEYCRWIQDPNSWGGYVDTRAIAEYFDVDVVTVDVQTGTVTHYRDSAQVRCYIVYSGIHYDALAVVPAGIDATVTGFDITQFNAGDEDVLKAAKEIAKILKDRHYFTDTAGFELKCNDCGWTGNGEKAAQAHGEATGHSNFSEGS